MKVFFYRNYYVLIIIALTENFLQRGASFVLPSCRNRHVIYPQSSSSVAEQGTTLDVSPSETITDDSIYTNTTILIPPFCHFNEPTTTTTTTPYPSRLHYIHVESLFTNDETTTCLELANVFAKKTGQWNQPDSIRHATYATCDFAVEECHTMMDYLQSINFEQRVLTKLQDRYGIDASDMSFLDLFCSNYRTTGMDRLEAHRDGSLLSFTIPLSPPDNYQGGGTFFDALRDVSPDNHVLWKNGVIRPPRAGDCIMHCGKLLHGANVITAGERTVLVGFVEVDSLWQRPGTLGEACRDFGRMDVAALIHKNQQRMTFNGEKRGWKSRNNKWLSTTTGSHLRGFLPVFDTTAKRADSEFQRWKKLEAEDRLLRNVLMTSKQENIKTLQSLFDGEEVSIL